MTEHQRMAVRSLVRRIIRYRSVQVEQETLELLERMSTDIAAIIGDPVSEVELVVCDEALKAASAQAKGE